MVNYNHLPKASRFFDGKPNKKMQADLKLSGFANRTLHGYLKTHLPSEKAFPAK